MCVCGGEGCWLLVPYIERCRLSPTATTKRPTSMGEASDWVSTLLFLEDAVSTGWTLLFSQTPWVLHGELCPSPLVDPASHNLKLHSTIVKDQKMSYESDMADVPLQDAERRAGYGGFCGALTTVGIQVSSRANTGSPYPPHVSRSPPGRDTGS